MEAELTATTRMIGMADTTDLAATAATADTATNVTIMGRMGIGIRVGIHITDLDGECIHDHSSIQKFSNRIITFDTNKRHVPRYSSKKYPRPTQPKTQSIVYISFHKIF